MTLSTRSESFVVLLESYLEYESRLLLFFHNNVDTCISGLFKPHPIIHELALRPHPIIHLDSEGNY